MILVDTGPFMALLQSTDGLHSRAHSAAITIQEQLFTTSACLTEASYLLGASGGWHAQKSLRDMIFVGDLSVLNAASDELLQAFAYMERFRDIPCDYADATLLVAAEQSGIRQIFSFDSHFYAYRLHNGDHLNVIP